MPFILLLAGLLPAALTARIVTDAALPAGNPVMTRVVGFVGVMSFHAPLLSEYWYFEIGLPPLLLGALKRIVSWRDPATIDVIRGAVATVMGVSVAELADASLVPFAFLALTRKT